MKFHLCAVPFVAACMTSTALGQCHDLLLLGMGLGGTNGGSYDMCQWDPDGNGPAQPHLVVATIGVADAMVVNGLGLWDGTRWSSLPANGLEAVFAVEVLDGQLFIAGRIDTGQSQVMRWDGAAWAQVGGTFSGDIWDLKAHDQNLIAAGTIQSVSGLNLRSVARWDGLAWHAMGGGVGGDRQALEVYQGDLYVAGSADGASTTPWSVARWNGIAWSPVGTPPAQAVNAMVVHEGSLIVGGQVGMTDGSMMRNAARWDGTKWNAMPGLSAGSSGITSLCVFNGQIHASGHIPLMGGARLIRWDGTAWRVVTNQISQMVHNIFTYDDQLIMSGLFTEVAGVAARHIGSWNGTIWRQMTDSVEESPLGVMDTEVYSEKLFAGGSFENIRDRDIRYIAQWDGRSWQAVGDGVDGPVRAMEIFDGAIIVGGEFKTAGAVPAPRIAKWDGTAWSSMLSQATGTFDRVHVLKAWNGKLVAGGQFLKIGPAGSPNIAIWDGTQWAGLGSGVSDDVHEIEVVGDNLYVRGDFTSAGGSPSSGFARWDGASWSSLGALLEQGSIDAMAAFEGSLFIAGYFNSINGVPCQYAARWDGSAWHGLNATPGVTAMHVIDGKLYALTHGPAMEWSGNAWIIADPGMVIADRVDYHNEFIAHSDSAMIQNDRVAVGVGRWSRDGVPWVALQPESMQIDPGATVELAAAPANGYEGVRFQWLRNGVEVLDGPGGAGGGGVVTGAAGILSSPTFHEQITLRIEGAQTADTGSFKVVIFNDCGEAISQSAAIRIGEPCTSDFDLSGFVDTDDFTAFVVAFEAGSDAADIDQSGFVDTDDFTAFVLAFESGC